MPDLQDAVDGTESSCAADSSGRAMRARSPADSSTQWLQMVVVVLALVQIGICWKALPAALNARIDFRAFYATGHLFAHGRGDDLYIYAVQQQTQDALFPSGFKTLPFLYPAYAATLFAPFALVPYGVAFLLFSGLNLVALAFAARSLCARVAALQHWPRILQFVVAAAFFPVSMALLQGQISILLLLVYLGFDRLLTRRMHFLAGLVLALGLVKFQVALPVALLFLAWRYYRLVLGFVCGAAGLTLASLALCGREGMALYWRSMTTIAGSTLLDPAGAKLRYGMFAGDMPNLHGLFFTLARGRLLGSELAALAALGVMLWAWRQRPSLAVALPAAMLVSYHMQAYDLVLLLLPLMLTLGVLQGEAAQGWPLAKDGRATKLLLVASVLLLTAPVAALLLVKGLSSVMALAVLCVLIAGRSVLSGDMVQSEALACATE